MSCQVKIKQGILQGKLCNYSGKEYYSFEGIPYAKPPIGDLRFREPQEPENWTGVRDALKPGNSCIQLKPGTREHFGSEDCLYLNVYTPSLPEKELRKLPVLVYVHGGKFLFGFGDYYRPEYLIEQDVILVTLNYRLHALGFLCLHIPEAAGNMGLKDTVMALKWVKNNISKFNGDENNIVAIGESAGGAIVTSYLISEMANGLVNKIIALSGVCVSDLFMIDDDPIFKAKHLASIFQQEFSDVRSLYDYLMKLPIEELLYAAAMVEYSRPPSIISAYFLPVVEKKFVNKRYFDEYPLIKFRENLHKKLPVLFGVNTYEGGFFIRQDKAGNIKFENDFRYFIPRFLFVQPYSADGVEIAKKIRNYYFDGAAIDQTKKLEYINFVSDAYFKRDIMTFLNTFGKHSDRGLYVFQLSHSSKMNTRKAQQLGLKGTVHGDLLQYIFYRKGKADIANEKDKEIITIINQTISNFARTGVPRWYNMPIEWKPYTDCQRHVLEIDENIKLIQDFGDGIDRFWSSLGQRSKL
ncbi:esterase E4-like [Cydia splendana]|uniref:esterase E4-like n=1 Tax=Cydia splendana TaxID=1100963 RepID=UPI002128EF36